MEIGMAIIACTFIFTIMIAIVYFSKEHVKTLETKTYNYILILSIINLIIEFVLCINIKLNVELYSFYNLVVNRTFLLALFTWFTLFTVYIINISSLKKQLLKKLLFLYYIIDFLLVVLPIELVNENGVAYSAGIAVNVLYVMCIVYIVFWLLLIIFNRKNMSRKAIPFIAYIICFGLILLLRAVIPGILLNSFSTAFASILMFFTIENPDIRMIEQLNIARDQADKANQAKSDFLSSMSHEIRTPLNAIVGFSESLKEEDLPDSAKDEVDDIISASESLLEIVNGILDISKIEANKLEIVNNEYDIHKMFKDLVSLTKVRIGEKPIELKVNIDQSIPQVLYGDHTRVKQIILNLLTNAAKYTDKGFIEFNVQSVIKDETCRLIISVKDTGKGIKQENIDKLFTKFERFDEKNSTIEGTGLGLAITKKLINLMGGSIVVNSVYQKGSNFMVSLDQAIVKNPTIIKEEPTKQVEQASYQDKKILIVDDNELNLKVAKRLLQTYEMQIDTVLSGDEALSKIRNNEIYDLILLDDMMPHKSGRETLTELRQIENFNIPVVVLTANAIEGMKEKYLEMGFDDYLAKPISKEELKRILLKYLN